MLRAMQRYGGWVMGLRRILGGGRELDFGGWVLQQTK